MKKLLLVSTLLFSSSVFSQDTLFGDWDDLFSKFGADGPTVKPKTFKVEAPGSDLRGYAFKIPHPEAKDVYCIFVAGTGKGGLSCVVLK